MKLADFPFEVLDWSTIPAEEHPGESGSAFWQTKMMNDIRVRRVKYSTGYRANHWCIKGHVLFCFEGQMETELADGRLMQVKEGNCYLVGDHNERHRSHTVNGCTLFIVD
jgi:hypothetical protein